jgi:BirA family biotin operon repressor/biotin-[acetyl-CoA-carboxylase] ligase
LSFNFVGFNTDAELTKIREAELSGFFLPKDHAMTSLLHSLINKLADGKCHSGPQLGMEFNVSRAAICKVMKQINGLGLNIHSVRGKGYRLQQSIFLLDFEKIAKSIPLESVSNLQELVILNSTDSTNSYAMREIQAGNGIPEIGKFMVYLAEQQTSGKGRRGREWVSPFGQNIYLTMVVNVDTGNVKTEGISLVVGLAVIRALESLGVSGFKIKWPNDLLFDNMKLAGILLEITGDIGGICQLIIGAGINVHCQPEQMQNVSQPWTDLNSITGTNIDRNLLAGYAITNIIQSISEFERHGLQGFLDEWQKYDAILGEDVELIAGESSRFGKARGISESGALLLETDGITQEVQGGEISLRRVLNP